MGMSPIGIFDSGVGGLSVLKEIRRQNPAEDLIYFADQAHVPYGKRSLLDVQGYATSITSSLFQLGCKVVVLACNTASAAALHHLRAEYPGIPFVGMEPAVKPAAETTASGVVGVLATPATFQGELYASVIERFAEGVSVLPATLPGLVERIERGDVSGARVKAILQPAVDPLLERGADTLVLACTHFTFVIPTLVDLVGPQVRVIDPSPAIARQVSRVLDQSDLRSPSKKTGEVIYITSGDPSHFQAVLMRLLTQDVTPRTATWLAGKNLSIATD
jgi:glutamate racemase